MFLGGNVRGAGDSERAIGVKCPKCGEASVWWAVTPRTVVGAMCSHRNSCGWHGWIDQLLQGGAAV